MASEVYQNAYETATKKWGWSNSDAEDLARNAEVLLNSEEPLKGRPLNEFWDVNPTRLLVEHKSKVGEQIRTRFPPEPNGYAHTGHAKSMYMNFKDAFDRVKPDLPQELRHTTFRYDDTNPEVESQEFIDKLADAVAWLGWTPARTTFTSDYFPQMFNFALKLIDSGDAYVCHQTGDEIEYSRNLSKARHAPGFDPSQPNESPESPWRNTSPKENRQKFLDMKRGLYKEGEASLRLKMDMYHQNPNMWDPVAYRVIYHSHPHAGDGWCIYPTYDYSHCIVDSLEDIDYSICTLEFETRRESYYWLLWKLDLYRPKVFEFARLSLSNTVMSKRKLKKLVETKAVRGWDDPRMPTLMGMRRRGFSKEVINAFMKDIGVTRNLSTLNINRFFNIVQDDLNKYSPRAFGILSPVPLLLENLPKDFSSLCEAPLYPQMEGETRVRNLTLTQTCYLDRSDVRYEASNDFYGAAPQKFVRLRYGPIVECKKVMVDSMGQVQSVVGICWFPEDSVHAKLNVSMEFPTVKPKGVLHWMTSDPTQFEKCEVRLYDHLFEANKEEEEDINPNSEIILKDALIEKSFIAAQLEEAARAKKAGEDEVRRFQLERVGFFCMDVVDCTPSHLVLNRIIPLNSGYIEEGTEAGGVARPSLRGESRKDDQSQQKAAKKERLKYSCSEFFKRPGEAEKYKEFDETGFPISLADGEPLSKSKKKDLTKELEKHKKEREKAGFSD